MAQVLLVDVYKFASAGNKFTSKALTAIPIPCQVVPATSPDPAVYCYSKVIYEMPHGLIQEGYTAETVEALSSRLNS